MRLQRQPNVWSCLPTAFAMVMDLPVQTVVDAVGHDGSEIVFPHLKDPQRRRAFHPQELLIAGLKLGFVFIPVCRQLVLTPDGKNKHSWIVDCYDEFISTHIGVITGVTAAGKRHSVAWDGTECFDPSGVTYNISAFYAEVFWPLVSR